MEHYVNLVTFWSIEIGLGFEQWKLYIFDFQELREVAKTH